MVDEKYDAVIESLSHKLGEAIAVAEGYYADGSLPQRINNPGDMKLGDRGAGLSHDKTVFVSAEEGWKALYHQCEMILTGASHVYTVNDTLMTVAVKYTGGDASGAWAKIVSEKLNLPVSITLAQWVKSMMEEA